MITKSVKQAVKALRDGGLVGVPTETVYGLAGYALDESVVRQIFEVKGRPFIDPLITHVYHMEQIEEMAEVDERARLLTEAFWPGPLTVVMRKREVVPDIVTAGLGSVGVRMPAHEVFREILKEFGKPLAAPSANPFGYVSPTKADHVEALLGDKISCVVDGGDCAIGIESTVLDLTGPAMLLRPGPISIEAIEAVIGEKVVRGSNIVEKSSAKSPGMLEKHYSPRTVLKLIEEGEMPEGEGIGVIRLRRPEAGSNGEYWLSEDGDLSVIGRNLFSLLRKLDGLGLRALYIEKPQNEGLGIAINDRLRRAAAK